MEIYFAHRLLEDFGVADGKMRTEHERFYQQFKHDSKRLLEKGDINIPVIDDNEELLGYTEKTWKEIKGASCDTYNRMLSLFTLTWILCEQFKRNERGGMIPVITTLFAERISEEQQHLSWTKVVTASLTALVCYELFLLWKKIH